MSIGTILGYTTNYRLILINPNARGWADEMHQNLRVIDAALLAATGLSGIAGQWENSTAYVVGNRVVDPDLGTLWQCEVGHTSAATGTFGADRTANPTYWSAILNAPIYRGTWTTSTLYNSNDFVLDGKRYAVCATTHTSTTSLDTDIANWDILIDAENLVVQNLEIDDTSADHQYIFAVSELAADRTVTLPLLTGNDTFVFENHAQTLDGKTLTGVVAATITGTAGLTIENGLPVIELINTDGGVDDGDWWIKGNDNGALGIVPRTDAGANIGTGFVIGRSSSGIIDYQFYITNEGAPAATINTDGITVNNDINAAALYTENSIERSSASPLSFNITNVGASTVTLQVDGVTVPTISSSHTLTNKTINSANNTLTLDLGQGTLTGTLSEFNTACQDESFTALGKLGGINAQTGVTYTFGLSDIGKLVTANNASAVTFTIPTNASVAFAVSSWISCAQKGAGTLTIAGDTGVTVNGVSAGSVAVPARYASFATIVKVGTNEWYINIPGVA